MKKFFAIALAAAMVASMSAVSLASVGTIATGWDDDPTVEIDDGDTYFPVIDAIGPFTYDNDDKCLENDTIEYGKTAYFLLIQGCDSSSSLKDGDEIDPETAEKRLVTESETVKSMKVKTDWEEGKSIVSSVSIVKKKVSNDPDDDDAVKDDDKNAYKSMKTLVGSELASSDSYTVDKYYYFLAIDTNSSTSTSDSDIIGTLTLSKSKDPKVDDLDLDVAINVGWENSYVSNASDYLVEGDVGPLDDETYYALKFDYDDEVDIDFEDDSTFTVDVSGQSKLLVYYDTDYNSKIAAKYPLAELNFWNGNGAKFNRVGEMFLACDQDYAQFLYQVNSDGTLSEVPGAEYDEYDGGFYFNTRVLGSYVISDMELDLPDTTSKDTTTTTPVVQTPVVTTPAPVVSNPSTGAAA